MPHSSSRRGEPVAWGLQVPGEEPYLRQIWVVKDAPFNQAKERWPEAYKDAYQVPLCLCTAPTIPEGWQIVPKKLVAGMESVLLEMLTNCHTVQESYDDLLAAAPKPEDVK